MRTKEEISEYILGVVGDDEEVVIFDDFCTAFLGLSHDSRAVYSWDLMVLELMNEGMTEEDAIEYIDYNTLRSLPYMGDRCPIVLYSIGE